MKSFIPCHSPRARQRGTSLLEVLIALLVLAVGMLGMAALQAVTLKNSNSSAARSQAIMQTYSMFDRLRLNREVARAGGFNVTAWTCAAASADPDDPDDDTDYSVFNAWLIEVQGALGPGACGRVQCGANDCKVAVRWDDSRATGNQKDPQEIETISGL